MISRTSRARWARLGTRIALAASCLVLPGAAPVPAPALPPNTILLLVAAWCAPCRSELALLDPIAEAAFPYVVRVMPIDADTAAGRRMVAAIPAWRRWASPAAPVVRDYLLARTPGLPYSAAIGADGRLCGEERGGLDPAKARALVTRCRTP